MSGARTNPIIVLFFTTRPHGELPPPVVGCSIVAILVHRMLRNSTVKSESVCGRDACGPCMRPTVGRSHMRHRSDLVILAQPGIFPRNVLCVTTCTHKAHCFASI